VQAPHWPPHESGPHLLLPHLGVQSLTHWKIWFSQCVPFRQAPQSPPQPSGPQVLPLQLGAHSHVPLLEQYCVDLHEPHDPPQPSSPQTFLPHVGLHGQIPQSCGQLVQVSPFCGSQVKLPHPGIGQQSLAQLSHVSPGSQVLLPQVTGHKPQSVGQLEQDSLASQAPLPHTPGQMPQSLGQLPHVSVLGLHNPSPQVFGKTEHWPVGVQTEFGGQTPQVPPQPSSPHFTFAHLGTQVPPHPPGVDLQMSTHLKSHATWQQKGFMSQTVFSHEQPLQPGVWVTWQPSFTGQSPQSFAQLLQDSPWVPAHTESPQTGAQAPQSGAQFLQFSVEGLHRPSPHVGAHGPQSPGQVLQVSPAWTSQLLLPQAGHLPQSFAQFLQSSPDSQFRLPHTGPQEPQSTGQVEHFSLLGSHTPSPHGLGQGPQSVGQELHDSGAGIGPGNGIGGNVSAQMPSPQTLAHGPQSIGQLWQLSPTIPSQIPLPHTGLQGPQSIWQLLHVSPFQGVHWPSPHTAGQEPQSCGQLEQLSLFGAQMPSPQVLAHLPPHFWLHSFTHCWSQAFAQQ